VHRWNISDFKTPFSTRNRHFHLLGTRRGDRRHYYCSNFLSTVFITPQMIEEDLAKQPCGSNTPQGYCYHLKRELCEVLWDKAHNECQQEMAEALKSRPTGLVGPAINRCKARHMDKGIRYNRAQTETAYCKAYFEYIEDPTK
jgi:hypothetical protein